eukprot:CAMPEP_0168610538 /NCGR_PEP_ID=MMETSP0449_2-20121227/1845_1 /TAXON_ID=1082188 /ORGANISM="Strombidium rassoulzadegani, Strain ras09" /LENGTH=49 /DNA_ID= /DNA_START= /DNA_END= /DNA_ORIENTATION=
MAEMCFNHVYQTRQQDARPNQNKFKFSKKQQVMVDQCVEKYMQSLTIVQ